MKKISYLLFLIAMAWSTQSNAQGSNEAIVKEWQRAKLYTKEYLDAMPEASYGYKPTPEMRSFSGQMLHLSDAINGIIAAATNETSPTGMGELEKSNDTNKESVSKKVLAAYDFAIASITKLPKEKLTENVKLFGRFEVTRGLAIDKCFEHQTHHRGQTIVYIRLAGATPPGEKLF